MAGGYRLLQRLSGTKGPGGKVHQSSASRKAVHRRSYTYNRRTRVRDLEFERNETRSKKELEVPPEAAPPVQVTAPVAVSTPEV